MMDPSLLDTALFMTHTNETRLKRKKSTRIRFEPNLFRCFMNFSLQETTFIFENGSENYKKTFGLIVANFGNSLCI